jgi:hypothetical protein
MLMPSLPDTMFARRVAAVALCLGSIAGMMRLTVPANGTSIVRTEDRNHDGQPDVWETHSGDDDAVVDVDTNFDGHPDERRRYRNGDLVSLEADSDFDNRVDIVEEFDPVTHDVVRSLIDIDKDGRADLLVLSHDGQPVFEKWADRVAAPGEAWTAGRRVTGAVPTSYANPPSDDGDLIPLADPFIGDITVRSTHPWRPAPRDSLLSTSGGLPLPAIVISSARTSVGVRQSEYHSSSRLVAAPASPRGPPIFALSPAAFL